MGTMTGPEAADTMQRWLQHAQSTTAADQHSARALHKKLKPRKGADESAVEPRDEAGALLVSRDVYYACDHWQGGRVLVRYTASFQTFYDGREPVLQQDTVYIEELRTPLPRKERGSWGAAWTATHRVIGRYGQGECLTAARVAADYAETPEGAIALALEDQVQKVEALRRKWDDARQELEACAKCGLDASPGLAEGRILQAMTGEVLRLPSDVCMATGCGVEVPIGEYHCAAHKEQEA